MFDVPLFTRFLCNFKDDSTPLEANYVSGFILSRYYSFWVHKVEELDDNWLVKIEPHGYIDKINNDSTLK